MIVNFEVGSALLFSRDMGDKWPNPTGQLLCWVGQKYPNNNFIVSSND